MTYGSEREPTGRSDRCSSSNSKARAASANALASAGKRNDGVCLSDLPPPFGVYFDGHETITMPMDHLPGAILSAVDRGCPQAHFVCLAVDLASEVL
jgi:hypothetical protein